MIVGSKSTLLTTNSLVMSYLKEGSGGCEQNYSCFCGSFFNRKSYAIGSGVVQMESEREWNSLFLLSFLAELITC